MYIIPAIDLRDGKCVRLIQGDYSRQINYEENPVKQAQVFISAGAEWLHVVDLDGAKAGKPVNTKTIADLAGIGKLKIEVGGGIRSEDAIKELLDLGIEQVIIGTKAVEDFQWFGEMACNFPGQIALGLDARGSKVATHGWTTDNPTGLLDFAEDAAKLPIAAIIYTDITRDGMMTGPNFTRTKALIGAVNIPIIASGGATKISDVTGLSKLGAAAAIIGRALYEGKLTLADAIAAAKKAHLKN